MIDPPTLPCCPDAEVIRTYAAGGFDEARASQLESHLLTCTQCETILDRCDDPSDAVIQMLTSLPATLDDETEYHQLRKAALALPVEFTGVAEATHLFQRASCLADPALGPLPCRLGNYELSVCIGRGASGAVYRARHLKLDQEVAVKVLDASRSFSTESFLQEMKTIGSLVHPHIVRATDAGEANGLHFLVMEYIDGVDAAQLLFRNGPLNLADACEVVHQAALGLQFVHERSLVHRDIKPSNLLVTVEGQVKLLDLGIATRSDVPSEGQPLEGVQAKPQGTFDYMPPEQWNDPAAVNARSDLYSLGCTLFKLLTGSVPPKHGAAASALRNGLSRLGVPRAVEKLLHQMLAPATEDRPHSVAEVLKALHPHTRGSDLRSFVATAYPNGTNSKQSSPVQPHRFSRRQLALTALAAAGASALLFPRLRFGLGPHLRRTAWRSLSPVEPELLLTLGNTEEVTYSYSEAGEISIASEEMALIHLGRPVTGLFTLEVYLQTNDQRQGGVFFQGQHHPTDQGRRFHFQTVELKSSSPQEQKLLWSQWTTQQNKGRLFNIHRTFLAEVPIPLVTHPLGQQLTITCGRQGMPEIAWNGKKLHESMWRLSLEARDLQRMSTGQLPTAFLGRLGLLHTQGKITFVQPRLAYL